MGSFLKQEVIGKEFNDKLNDVMYEYFMKRKFSELGFIPRPGAIAMVHTLEDGMIKEVGASEPGDIINDNFGKWLAAMCSPSSGGQNVANQKIGGPGGPNPIDITNTSRTKYYYNDTNFQDAWNSSSAGVSSIQIGSGLTAPDVSDFNIETPFVSVPENAAKTVVSSGGYSPGNFRVNVGTNIGPTGGSGTINEVCLFTTMRGGGTHTFLMSHDAISPGVGFGIGETIFVQYFFQL